MSHLYYDILIYTFLHVLCKYDFSAPQCKFSVLPSETELKCYSDTRPLGLVIITSSAAVDVAASTEASV